MPFEVMNAAATVPSNGAASSSPAVVAGAAVGAGGLVDGGGGRGRDVEDLESATERRRSPISSISLCGDAWEGLGLV